MGRLTTVFLGAVLAAALSPASAAPVARAVLFSEAGFHGRWIGVSGGAADLAARNFAGRALSGRFDGEWLICAGPDFGGRCASVSGEVTDLSALGFDRAIVSLRPGEAASAPAPATTAAHPALTAPTEPDDGYFDRGPAQASPGGKAPRVVTPPAPVGVVVAPADRGVAGYASVFFVRPQRDGADVAGEGREAADGFCRDQGLGLALSYDSNGRALRDVLCKKQ